jgi:hypothetical protein
MKWKPLSIDHSYALDIGSHWYAIDRLNQYWHVIVFNLITIKTQLQEKMPFRARKLANL